jgi:hypothetical protein
VPRHVASAAAEAVIVGQNCGPGINREYRYYSD